MVQIPLRRCVPFVDGFLVSAAGLKPAEISFENIFILPTLGQYPPVDATYIIRVAVVQREKERAERPYRELSRYRPYYRAGR